MSTDGSRRFTIAQLRKKGTKTLVRNCAIDQQAWLLFATTNRSEFMEYYFNSSMNDRFAAANSLPFPDKFKTHQTGPIPPYFKANNARWKNHTRAKESAVDTKSRTPRYQPDLPLQHTLKSGKKELKSLSGYGLIDCKFIGSYYQVLTEINALLRSGKYVGFFEKKCNCKLPIICGYNMVSKCYTLECDLACRCGSVYMRFTFGNSITHKGKNYKENLLRFTALISHCKVRFALAEKLDLYFGLKAPDKRTVRKYKDHTDKASHKLAKRYMTEAIEEGKQDKITYNSQINLGVDGSYNTQGYQSNLGQCTAILTTKNSDTRTGRRTKVVGNFRRNRGERYGKDHTGSAGSIEVKGLGKILKQMHKKGLDVDIVTKDLDTPSAKQIRTVNHKYGTTTEKGCDFNHTLKAGVGKALDSKKKKGKKIWKAAKCVDSTFTHAQSSKHKSILYKRTTKILRTRKQLFKEGKVTFFFDFFFFYIILTTL
eukprot:885621_1